MSDPDEMAAYQATQAWMEQSPPGFLCPKVVPSIVSLRDLVQQPLPPEPDEQQEFSLATPKKGKEVLSAALESLDGLDKEEANLIYASPWTVPLTQMVTGQAAGSPKQALDQLQACASASPRKVCQYPFKKNDIVWMCRTCQADETCAMCHDCYSQSNHEGHDVAFFHAQEGGCCDCGDPEAWDPKGFCPNHGEHAAAPPRRAVCQYPFKKNDIVWMCRTCQADETCAMCHECYNNSDHEGHDVAFFHAQEGGCCDCGDPDAWDPKGFCSNHGTPKEGGNAAQQSIEDQLAPGMVARVRGIVPGIMDWMVTRFAETAKTASDRTMLPLISAEASLGPLGRQGHGLYLVLQADDVHSQPEYIEALRHFLGPSSYYDDAILRKLAQTLVTAGQLVVWGTMELATECGRDQARCWLENGDPSASSTIASVFVKRVTDLKRRGFYCRIMTLQELQQEQQAIAVIQWVAALAFSCDPLCQTVANYIHPERHLSPLLKADFVLSSRFTKAWYSLLLNLLAVPAFKSNLGAAYCDTYDKLTEECSKGKGVIERSAYALSVQFLNRDTYVMDLVSNRDLLSKLGKALLATLRAAEVPNEKRLNPNHVVLNYRRYLPCISDLKYVINVKGMKRLITCDGGTFLTDLLTGISLAQCMDTHSWRQWDLGHVEEEDVGWYGAFNLSIQLGSLYESVLSFEDDDPSPVQNPKSPFSGGLLTCAELCYDVLGYQGLGFGNMGGGIYSWQKEASTTMQATPYSSAVDGHRRRPASLPFSTIAAKHGCSVAFRQLPVGQVTPFSLHLPLHRFLAACIRELCLRSDENGTASLFGRLTQAAVSRADLDDLFHGVLEWPVLVLSRACQIRAGLWRRNGPGLNEQVVKYSDPNFCRSMRDADLILVQFAALQQRQCQSPTPRPTSDGSLATFVHLFLHRLGLFEFAGLAKAPSADPDAYETEASKGLFPHETGEDNGCKSGLVLPWTYTPARDASDCRALMEEFLYMLIIFATELPPPPPVDEADRTNQAKWRLRREVIHRLAASPKTHSELADIHLVLSFRDNTLLNEVGKSINPDDATAAMLGQILADVAERKASRSRLEPDKFVLLKSAWASYDPSFWHISVESHQTAAESRPVPSSKDEAPKGLCGPIMPYAPPPPPAHPRFERLRRDVSSDQAVLATIYKILHMHCRESQRDDIVTLRTGRLAYDNDAKSEVCVARAVHLLTLGCFAWQNAKQDVYGWQERGGGSPGGVFFDREESPSVEKWVDAAFLTDPNVLMDCSWYEGEENTLLLLRRLAVDGGAGGVFVVQDPAVQAGAAWLCEFAVQHSTEAEKLVGKIVGKEGEEKTESELERRKQLAREKAMAKMNAQAAMFADMMNIDLKETDDGNDDTIAKSSEETEFERKKREARERALARINNQAIKFATSAGIELGKGSEIQLEKKKESEFERRKREAKEKALARINGQATKFALLVGLETKDEEKDETEMEKRKRIAKEKAIARMNAQAAKFAAFADVELDNKLDEEGDQKVSATNGDSSSNTLRKEKPQCIICSESDAECFVAFSQGSTVLKGGGPWSTSDERMAYVRRYAGTYVALCGHAMHSACSASYLAKVLQKDDQGSGKHGEFRCPLCQRPSNCLVPFVDVAVDWIDSSISSRVNLLESAGSDLHNFLATSPWWTGHNKNFVWDGHGAFIDKHADCQVEASDQATGEVMVLKNLLEHISGISYEADSKRLGSDNLHSDLGEFRHFITEKHYYDKSTECSGWPLCLLSEPVEDGVLRAFSREKFMAQLLTAIQSLTYSACCETFDARRHIDLTSGAEAAAARAPDELKQVLSKFGIAGALCEGQLILMPKPSSTEDEGAQPFHGRFGRLRNFGVALMAAAGAFGPDLMQVVLQLPTSLPSVEEKQRTPQRAPIAFPLLMGHVLTHIVAAISITCGRNISPSEWAKVLGGKVGTSEASEKQNPANRIAWDCECFLKLGFLARTIQALCRELGVGFEKSSDVWQFIHGLQMSDYSCSKMEKDWIESCRVLLAAVGAPPMKESVPPPAHFKETFQSACLVASGAGAAFLADAGTIVQVLVPGIMARYEEGAVYEIGEEKIPSLRRLSMLRSLFKFESVDKMVESSLVAEVIRKWYCDACAYEEKARPAPLGKQLLVAHNFRSWDWPLESARGYPGIALGPIKMLPKKSTPLLGGYTYDIQTGDNQLACVDVLTLSYMDLYAKIAVLKPDADRTAVCLVCGEALDASGVGECTKHSYVCGAGTGIFFLLQDCVGLIMHRGEGSFIHSIYVDSHGETPRGRPLYLDLARYDHLRDLWCGHGVRQRVLVERESTQQGVLTGFY